MLTEWVNADVGNFIHDKAGWMMMPLAMLMIWGEMSLLAALLIETTIEGPLSFGGGEVRRGGEAPLAGPGPLVRGPTGRGVRRGCEKVSSAGAVRSAKCESLATECLPLAGATRLECR